MIIYPILHLILPETYFQGASSTGIKATENWRRIFEAEKKLSEKNR